MTQTPSVKSMVPQLRLWRGMLSIPDDCSKVPTTSASETLKPWNILKTCWNQWQIEVRTIPLPFISQSYGAHLAAESVVQVLGFQWNTGGKQEENVFPIKCQTQNIQEFHAIPRFLRIFFGIFVSHHSLILRTVPISAPHTGLTGNLEASLACSWSRAILAASDQSFRLCATALWNSPRLVWSAAQLNTETVDAIRNLEAALLLASEISNAKRIDHYSFRMMSKMDKIYVEMKTALTFISSFYAGVW